VKQLLSIFISLALVAGPCFARSSRGQRAARHKKAAYSAFDRGAYDTAIREFEASYRLKPDPRLFYNLGLAYFRRYEASKATPDLHQARTLFHKFLDRVPLPPRGRRDRKKVAAARRFTERYLERIAALESPPAPPPPASASPTSAPIGFAPSESGESQMPIVVNQPSPATPRPPSGVAHWVLYGLAGAAGVAAGVTGGLALKADRESDDLAAGGDPAANDRADRTRTLALSTDILIGAAVLAAAVGLVLHLRDHYR